MKFSRLSALSVAIGAGAAFACGGGDTSTTNSQGGTDSSESTSSAELSTTVESSGAAGAAKSDAGTSTPGPNTKTFGSSVDASAANGSTGATTSSSSATSAEAEPSSSSASHLASSSSTSAAAISSSTASGSSSGSPAPLVSFQTDVYPILLANCGMTCHATGDSSNGMLTLGTSFGYLAVWEELLTKGAMGNAPDTTCEEAYVINLAPVDQNPAGSLLYQKITGVGIPAGCGVQMPKGGPYLSAADQETIKNWILDNDPL
ncbi:MAG: hypothetical protein ABSF69_27265 [Polyangiaceae bacterium]